jgi:hypothetical protein
MTTNQPSGAGSPTGDPSRVSPLVGKRVRLIRCDDPYTHLEPGTTGTVGFVDDMGTVHVRWDDGHYLGLVESVGDRFEVL